MLSSTSLPLALAAIFLAGPGARLFAQVPRDRVVEVRAAVLLEPPRITLYWPRAAFGTVTGQHVYRRLKGGPAWIELASLPVTATSYADKAVAAGTSYEYFVQRIFSGAPGTACGYLSSGIVVPFVAERGKVILLVDDTMSTPLAPELAQFTSDLTGDGWEVLRQEVSRTATVPSVRAVVQSFYNADPTHTVALILFGHIPVPYSGDIAPDGHPGHTGAWPADVYYGDMNGTWTDSTVNDTQASLSRNDNVPGDGKFDQSVLPSDVDLEVGRIDLANMPAYSASETDLLRQYLARDHAYRFHAGAYAGVPRRGFIVDAFGYVGGESFATAGWRSFISCFGSANVQAAANPTSTATPSAWFITLKTQKYLFAYACGAGSQLFNGATGIGLTFEFADTDSHAVFCLMFGSYFGDWDTQDNLLRAPLGGTAGSLGLASAWVGRPYWYFHPMAMGETIGYGARLSQNNLTSFPGGYEANTNARGVFMALMGDPTLRLHSVLPPANLVCKPRGSALALSWKRSPDAAIAGYLVSRAATPAGPFQRVFGGTVPTASFIDRTIAPGATCVYMVRAVKRESSPSGTYLNPSQGIFTVAVTAAAATGPQLSVTGNGNAVADGDTRAMSANGTDFGSASVGQSVAHTFTVKNVGLAPLALSSARLTGANAADFSIGTPPPATLGPGASASLQISFHPSVASARSAKFSMRCNDPNQTLFDFTLAGVGN